MTLRRAECRRIDCKFADRCLADSVEKCEDTTTKMNRAAEQSRPVARVVGSGDFSIGSLVWPGVSKLVEECAEVLQICGKLMGTGGEVKHWDGQSLDRSLEAELGDLLAAIEFVKRHCPVDRMTILSQYQLKIERFEEWHRTKTRPPEHRPPTVTVYRSCLHCGGDFDYKTLDERGYCAHCVEAMK